MPIFSETAPEAWMLRYGSEPPGTSPISDSFFQHRSVRDFSDREISEETMRWIFAAGQSAATSSSLQLWSAVSIQEPEQREKAARLCADQNQIRNAKWFFAFLADTGRLRQAAKGAQTELAGAEHAETFILAAVDAALAAERMVCAAESIGIGSCYIGALRDNPEEMRELLGFPEGVFGMFGLCFGYPSEQCTAAIKPRLSQDAAWHREQYPPHPDFAEYDSRMREFYEEQKMKGDVTWSMRSVRRLTPGYMSSREGLKNVLEKFGFWKK